MKFNRRLAITLGGVLLLVGGTGTGIVMAQQSSGGQSALQDQAVISEAEASAIAQNAYPDTTVKDVELEKEHGLLIYDVELDNGLELAVNAADGSIVSTEQDDDWQAWDDDCGAWGDDGEAWDDDWQAWDDNGEAWDDDWQAWDDDDEAWDDDWQAWDDNWQAWDNDGEAWDDDWQAWDDDWQAWDNDGEAWDDDWQAWDYNDEVPVAPGQIDGGAELLSQASITLDQAITAAQQAQDGPLGEIDLEKYQGKLVFNVEIGQYDVKVDASNASILGVDQDD